MMRIFKKSLFRRIMFPVIAVVLLSMVVLGAFQIQKLNEYVMVQEENRLIHMATRLAELAVTVEEQYSPGIERFFRQNINALSKDGGSYIVVTDARGQVVARSENCGRVLDGELVPSTAFEHVKEKRERFVRIGPVNLHRREEVLSVATPILYDNTFYGAVIIHLPVPFLSAAKNEVIRYFLFAFIIVSVISIILLLLVAQRIVGPVRKVQRAARAVARGDFDVQLDIRSTDEIGELATDFNAMTLSLKNQDQNQRNFIGDLSHELRTPMTTISGFLEGIIDGVIPKEETDKYLNIVLEETRRLSRLVNQLLELTRMESGSVALEQIRFDLNELVRLVLIGAEQRIEDKNLQVEVDLPDEAWAYADPDQIRRVLNNLTDNAIKFTPASGRITLAVRLRNGKYHVEIENSGAGIEPDELPHLFERFYKSDKSRGMDKSGAGLGLYMVRNILKQHGEDIRVESIPNEKTIFAFTLKKASAKEPS